MTFKKAVRNIISFINKLLPKFNQVIVQGFPNTESSAISVANYISKHYDLPVYYVIYNEKEDNPGSLLLPDIILIEYYWGNWNSIYYLIRFMTSKFIFFTHGSLLNFYSDRQTVTNIWHGVLYKRVGLLNDKRPILSDVTVGTSQATKKMFSEAFGVAEDSVYASGYPRNDMLLNAKKNRAYLKKRMDGLGSFKKIVIWMPTYRKSIRSEGLEDGVEVGNPFYIKNFKLSYFNELLKEFNALCFVKPHPNAPEYTDLQSLSNVTFIDSEWVTKQGLTLYQLLGCSDLLISDVSSVIIDYMLLDQPIICVSTDFEEYRETRGFYFDNIENWIPSPVITNQESFFDYLQDLLKENDDPFGSKRKKLKNYFFDDQDAGSTERLVKYVLEYKS